VLVDLAGACGRLGGDPHLELSLRPRSVGGRLAEATRGGQVAPLRVQLIEPLDTITVAVGAPSKLLVMPMQ
jgi:hypothetical protein